MDPIDQAVDAILEREAYRSVLSAALTALHETQKDLTLRGEQHARLVDEYRAFRASMMRADA